MVALKLPKKAYAEIGKVQIIHYVQSATDSHNILINESVLCVCGVSLKHKCLALDVKYSLSDYLPGDR